MFDFDAGKFLIIGVVALLVIGPKELPRVLRQVGQAVGKMRRMATEFQGQFMDAMKEADIESIRQDLKKIGQDAELSAHFDPARDIQRELTASFDAPATVHDRAVIEPAPDFSPVVATEGSALPMPASEPDAVAPFDHHDVMAVDAASLDAATALEVDRADALEVAPPRATAKKRKIRVPRRSRETGRRVHAVADRTALGRLRTVPFVRPRDQEIAER